MNTIQNYRITNYQSTLTRNASNPNFKAYNLKSIQDGLKIGKIPTDAIIEEMKADYKMLENNRNFDNIMEGAELLKTLFKISNLKLKMYKSAYELKISLQKCALVTAKPEEKIKIQETIAQCENEIKEIDKLLNVK